MRVAKLERFGHVDLDHVLGVTEPWLEQGIVWFSLILAFRDAHETRGWNDYELLTQDEWEITPGSDMGRIMLERIEVKRQAIIEIWKGDV